MNEAAELIRATGLMADGPGVVGRPIGAPGPGVYVIELVEPRAVAPIDINRVGKWIERVPTLRLDGERPTSKMLAARLAAFWPARRSVVYVGSTAGSIGGRVKALDRHVLGDPRPHAAAQWLKTLVQLELRVWWAGCDAPEEYEDALLDAFAAGLPADERAALGDAEVVLPFANLRRPTGERKRTGLTGATLPAEPPPPPTTIVDVPPGDAEGARGEPKPHRRPTAGRSPAARATSTRAPARAQPSARRPRTAASPAGSTPEPTYLSADGIDRMRAELEDLTRVRRPQVVARIRAARELGDLKENAEYHAAREEQSFLEGRVQALESRLRGAVVVEAPAAGSRVSLGSRVSAENAGEVVALTIVDPVEADPASGRISTASPVGKALIGLGVGDEAVVRTPGGEVRYRVVAID